MDFSRTCVDPRLPLNMRSLSACFQFWQPLCTPSPSNTLSYTHTHTPSISNSPSPVCVILTDVLAQPGVFLSRPQCSFAGCILKCVCLVPVHLLAAFLPVRAGWWLFFTSSRRFLPPNPLFGFLPVRGPH